MAIGEAKGPGRAREACEVRQTVRIYKLKLTNMLQLALKNPLISDGDLRGATGAIINITGNDDLTLMEVCNYLRANSVFKLQSHFV
jgi:cell division GTPase FtsZ